MSYEVGVLRSTINHLRKAEDALTATTKAASKMLTQDEVNVLADKIGSAVGSAYALIDTVHNRQKNTL